jgi:undecaprenyl pyrophosphate phosphatase UppP
MAAEPLVTAALLGLVEGVTEFIPVSSTGHLILAGYWLGHSGETAKTFDIFIQLGAILAIVWLYRERLVHVLAAARRDEPSRRFLINLGIAFLPAAIVGFLSIPVMFAATLYDLFKSRGALSASDAPVFAVGFVVAFVSAVVVVKSFLRYVSHHSFAVFAWYRLALGVLLLLILR